MRFTLNKKKSVEETDILRSEFDELLQDQLAELRPLRRRTPTAVNANNEDVSLSVNCEENATGLSTIVKIGS